MIYTSMRKFIVDTYDWWNCLFASPSPRALTQNVEKWGERGGWVVAIKLKLTTLAKIMFKVFLIANKIQSWIGDSDTSLKFSTLLHSPANLGFWRCSTLCLKNRGCWAVGPMCEGGRALGVRASYFVYIHFTQWSIDGRIVSARCL